MSAEDPQCNGCVGRGAGTRCCMCGLPIPELMRLTTDSPSEYDPGCPRCRVGAIHSHIAHRLA